MVPLPQLTSPRAQSPCDPPRRSEQITGRNTFSTWEEWRSEGVWWRRERLSAPTVYRDVDMIMPPRRHVRRSPWQRP